MQTSLFRILGPIMIGPSSSHTAGAERIGRAAHIIAGGDVTEVTFQLHGSFAQTGKGHGTDRALIAGVLGLSPDDERIKYSYELAKERGLQVHFETADLGEVHPNTVRMLLKKADGTELTVTGSSVGGGNISIININGVESELSGDFAAGIVTHYDKLGMISRITRTLANHGVNIVTLRHKRESKGSIATTMIEVDQNFPPECVTELNELDGILSVITTEKF